MTEETSRGSGALSGKTAIITGGASGIGLAIATAFDRQGAGVSIVDQNEAGARAAAEAIGGSAIAFGCDVSDAERVRETFGAIFARGRVNILVNNAGVAHVGTVESTNEEDFDRILRAEGKDPNRYKVTKQADTVMLFFLFRQDELREIFGRLGYDYRADTVTRNVGYYDRRTSHGSTLSFVTHAGVLATIDPESSWDRFLVALHSDADDIQGGTTKEGIHMGVMSGTLDLVQRNYAGAHVYDDVLHFNPQLPSRLDSLSFSLQFRQTPIQVTLTADHLTLAVHPEGASRPVRVAVRDDVRGLRPGDQTMFELSRNPATTGPSARD